MPLTPGTRIGAYDVTGPLGAGGMGEVYRARDTKLDRDVALKVLPEAFTADPDRLARFEREARVLASLNHPNIAQIHGLEETGGTRALVLELVEGPTLADRLAGGPIPLDEVLTIAWQIAFALQGAHEAGVVHRDLKPANIKVREDGTVKVLDFGLAKALDTSPATTPPPAADPLQSPTLTASVTRMGGGLILGTPAYMSPEQAEGQPTDTRGDLWSFGVVLYEMLAGERLFAGETVAQVLARVIDRDLDLSVLPPTTPQPVRRLLARCLERDRRRRMRDAGEAISDLEAAVSAPGEPPSALPHEDAGAAPNAVPPSRWRPWVAGAAVGLALGGLAAATALWTLAPAPAPPVVRRLSLDLPSRLARGSAFALSPDGSMLAYAGRDDNRRTRRLLIRRLDQATVQPLAGTEGAVDPFFSPDGAWIGFFAGSGSPGPSERVQYRWALKKSPVGGGAPMTLADDVPALGGSWGDDDRIVIGGMGSPLRVPAAGGLPEPVLPPGAAPDLAVCSAPQVLPGSRALLYAELSPTGGSRLQVVSLAAAEPEPRVVATEVARATYAPTGHLLLQQAARLTPGRLGGGVTNLMAAPFDADRLELTGAPLPVVPNAGFSAWASDGTLVYAAGAGVDVAETLRTLVWLDRDGREEPVQAAPRAYGTPRISPSGDRVAVEVSSADGATVVVVHDLARGASNALTFDGWSVNPLWSPDGRRVVFTSIEDDVVGLFHKAADGTGRAEPLTAAASTSMQTASAWVSAADSLLVTQAASMTDTDIHRLSLDDGRGSEPLIATASVEVLPVVSPDGRWIAYQSNESGRWAVYVRPFPNVEDGKWQVSPGGGFSPVWSPVGRELFFLAAGPDGRAMMAVEYAGDPTFTPSRPQRLFALPSRVDVGGILRQWDVAPDGRRFLMIKDDDGAAGNDSRESLSELVYVGNWFTELVERVPLP
ncbi:MAG: protein kinase [Acidobacteria bacterium]|nr:protein kinase [Acidobacteriota bacterium]